MGFTYKDVGVDIEKADHLMVSISQSANRTTRPEVLGKIGAYAGLFELNFVDKVLVSSTDGVGTKLKVASLMGKHSTIGIDLVAMSINDIICSGAEPLFFLDYFSTGRLDSEIFLEVIEGIATGCAKAGVALLGGETAELPGTFPDGEYDLAGFCVGLADKSKIPSLLEVKDKDIIIGLPSSGLHSNGYSLARYVLLEKAGLDLFKPAEGLDKTAANLTLGDVLLTPTKIYTGLFRDLPIKSLAHITGGGLIRNVPRALPQGLCAQINRSAWTVPPVFNLIRDIGGIEQSVMDETFNNGIGMVLVADPTDAPGIIRELQKKGEKALCIGKVKSGVRGVTFVK